MGPRRDAEFRVKVLEVFSHRVGGEEERRANLFVCLSSCNERQHLAFSVTDSKLDAQGFPDWVQVEALKDPGEVGAERIEEIAFPL
jgi:hypothetical protein